MAGEVLIQSPTYFDYSPRLSKLSVITPTGGSPSLVIPNRKNGIMSAYEMQAVVDSWLPANSANSYIQIREGREASTSRTILPESYQYNLYWMNLSRYIDTFLCDPDETPSQTLIDRQCSLNKDRFLSLLKENLVNPGVDMYNYATYPLAWNVRDGAGLRESSVFAFTQNWKYKEGFSVYETTNVGKWGGAWYEAEVNSGFLHGTDGAASNPRVMIFPGIAAGTLVECRVTFPAAYARIKPAPTFGPSTWTPSFIGWEVAGDIAGVYPNCNSNPFGERVSVGIIPKHGEQSQYYFYQTSTYQWYAAGFTAKIQFRVPASRMMIFLLMIRDFDVFWENYAVNKWDSNDKYIFSELELGYPDLGRVLPQAVITIDRIYTE